MALNQEYFDAIHIDVVKKKYYNANKVNAVFEDIRQQAEALNAENEAMRRQLDSLNDKKAEIGGAVLSAQTIYREVVAKANERAAQIIAEAERRSAAIVEESMRQQEYAVQRVEACYARMKQQHLSCIEALNDEWQDFLCGLLPEEAAAAVPSDMEEKLGAIAQELFAIGQDEDEEDEEPSPAPIP